MSFDELANGIGALDLPPETAMDFARVGISATGSALSLSPFLSADFVHKALALTRFGLSRDLHCGPKRSIASVLFAR